MAAVDDAGRDPRRLRRSCAATSEMLPLADAARCRSRGRLAGRHQRHARDDRVQLQGRRLLPDHRRPRADADAAILVEREEKIRAFVPRDYWEVRADVRARRPASTRAAGSTRSSRRTTTIRTQRAERLWERGRAPTRSSPPAAASRASSPRNRSRPRRCAPLLFDLTSLQREANGRFGFSAKNTLSLAQALYEKHKVLTYPRTDSRALPEDYLGTVKADAGRARRDQRLSRSSPSRS